LRQLIAEDRTLRVRIDGEATKAIVAGTSERQLEKIVARLSSEFNVESAIGALHVIYKEMFTQEADGEARFVRQSGARGQYAHVKIHLFPGELGSGYVFRNAIDSGSIPAEFISPIERGIKEVLARRSMVCSGVDDLLDVTIELYDGSYHDIDSSEMAFRIAGGMAFEDASAKARPVLLEPFMWLEVVVPTDVAGDVMGDLSKRRGAIRLVENRGETHVIGARISLSTIIGYEGDLRSLTGELGTCSIQFDGYEPCNVPQRFDDDDRLSSVRTPSIPPPRLDDSSIALPEPDGDRG
jgi:elongation factor G